MGDDLSLPERAAVRTPMQWSGEANAGFSTAPAKSLVRPVIGKGPFSHQKVNVAAQQREPGSLLNRFEQLIRVRNQCPEIGRAPATILDTGEGAVLALRYQDGERGLIVLHNLSGRKCTPVVGLGEGVRYLTDLLDGYTHVEVEDKNHAVEMEPYSCRWLRVNGER